MTEWLPFLLAFQLSTGTAPFRATPVPAPGANPTSLHDQAIQPDTAPDRWFAEDKLRHFFLSFAATGMAYGAARTVGLDGAPAHVVAASFAGAAGVWKEWRDHNAGGPFSARDLTWDALGIATGLLLTTATR